MVHETAAAQYENRLTDDLLAALRLVDSASAREQVCVCFSFGEGDWVWCVCGGGLMWVHARVSACTARVLFFLCVFGCVCVCVCDVFSLCVYYGGMRPF